MSLDSRLPMPENLEEFCPKSGKRHQIADIQEFCGKCGQKNLSFVPVAQSSSVTTGSSQYNALSLPNQQRVAMAPREVSVAERTGAVRSPAEILRQQGMNRRSRAIVASPNAGARALSMRSNPVTSAVVGQLLNELEVDVTVWNRNYYYTELPSGLTAKKIDSCERFGNSMRIYLKDRPFTTIENHIREDILSRWPQQRIQTEFGNDEIYLAHEVHRTHGPVIASINPLEIQTLFDLVSKFVIKSSGGAKVRRHVMHVVLDNLCPELAPSIASQGNVSDAVELSSFESKFKSAEGRKGKGKKTTAKENWHTKMKGTSKKKPQVDDFCVTEESEDESWINSPSPVIIPQSTKSIKGKINVHGSKVAKDNTIAKLEPAENHLSIRSSPELEHKSKDPFFKGKQSQAPEGRQPQARKGKQPEIPICISSDSDDLPTIEELFSKGAKTSMAKNKSNELGLSTDKGTSINPQEREASTREKDSSPQADRSKHLYVKPEWISPPRGWWSEDFSSRDFDESFQAMRKEDLEAREQIAMRTRSEKRSGEPNDRSDSEVKEALKILTDGGVNSQGSPTPSLSNTNAKISKKLISLQPDLSLDTGPEHTGKVANRSINTDTKKSPVITSKPRAVTENSFKEETAGLEDIRLDQMEREEITTPIDTSQSQSKPFPKKKSTKIYSNVQTRAARKKLAETLPPQNDIPEGSRALRNSDKGKTKKT